MNNKLSSIQIREIIEKLKHDIEHTKLYIEKLKEDRMKMRRALQFCDENIYYLRTHCGIIGIDYLKSLRIQMGKLDILSKVAEEEIKKFENSIEKQVKTLNEAAQELDRVSYQESNKVLLFKRRT